MIELPAGEYAGVDGVAFYDPVTMVVAPLVLILVALAACRIPAGRAMRVDPAGTLRQD